MPYNIDASHFGLAPDIALGGWLAAIPFSFAPDARLIANWENLLLVAHLATARENGTVFRRVTSSALVGSGSLVIRQLQGDPVLKADQVRLSQVCAHQTVGESETLWVYRGIGLNRKIGLATGLTWSPPHQAFADWGKADANRFGWQGEVHDIGRLAYARVDWSGSQYFRAVDLAGPSGGNGTSALANSILNCFQPYAGDPPVAQPGAVCARLSMRDRSRTKPDRELDLFGNDPKGVSQVQNATGAVWFAHGSFIDLPPDKLIRLTRLSHHAQIELSSLLGDMPVGLTMLQNLGERSPALRCSRNDVVFEGISLWDLKQRQDANMTYVADPPVLL